MPVKLPLLLSFIASEVFNVVLSTKEKRKQIENNRGKNIKEKHCKESLIIRRKEKNKQDREQKSVKIK